MIDQDPEAFRKLRSSFKGRKITGIGFDQRVLEEAGIEEAAAFAAVSSGDNSNVISARVVRESFGVERVAARIYDPRRAEVYQRLGIPTVATVRWTADQMLRRLLPEGAEELWRDPTGEVMLAEVAYTTAWVGEKVHELEEADQGPGGLHHPAGRGHAAGAGDGAAGGGRPACDSGADDLEELQAALGTRDGPRRRGRRKGRRIASRRGREHTDAGRHRRRRRGWPLDRAPNCWRTGTRCCSSTRTPGPSRWTACRGPSGCSLTPAEITSLDEAALERCNVVISATGDDKANLVVSLLAKTEYGVPRVVARINHPKNEWLFNESWGVDVAVSTPRLLSALVEEAVSVGDLVRLMTFRQSEASLVELTMPEDAPLAGSRIGDISWPADTALVAILREGRVIVPQSDDPLAAGDELLFVTSEDVEDELGRLLAGH